MNAIARRLNGVGSWVAGSPCLVNAVARRLYGGVLWVGELVGVADVELLHTCELHNAVLIFSSQSSSSSSTVLLS